MLRQKTYSAKKETVERRWLVLDARGQVLGRLATRVAVLLRGKHKPTYTPHVDTGDYVVVINAAELRLTANKATTKIRYRHSGYPGGLKAEPYGRLLARDPGRAFRAAVKWMLPHNPLGRQMLRKLKVYAGAAHPHAAQAPEACEL
jgi:large subunit ribosomal protein L13